MDNLAIVDTFRSKQFSSYSAYNAADTPLVWTMTARNDCTKSYRSQRHFLFIRFNADQTGENKHKAT